MKHTLAIAVLAGGVGLSPNITPQDWWCPGQPIPPGAIWNMATCHQFHFVAMPDGSHVAVQGP
jgi:hypothetical protein